MKKTAKPLHPSITIDFSTEEAELIGDGDSEALAGIFGMRAKCGEKEAVVSVERSLWKNRKYRAICIEMLLEKINVL